MVVADRKWWLLGRTAFYRAQFSFYTDPVVLDVARLAQACRRSGTPGQTQHYGTVHGTGGLATGRTIAIPCVRTTRRTLVCLDTAALVSYVTRHANTCRLIDQLNSTLLSAVVSTGGFTARWRRLKLLVRWTRT